MTAPTRVPALRKCSVGAAVDQLARLLDKADELRLWGTVELNLQDGMIKTARLTKTVPSAELDKLL